MKSTTEFKEKRNSYFLSILIFLKKFPVIQFFSETQCIMGFKMTYLYRICILFTKKRCEIQCDIPDF